ncbi:MAG: acetamidase/formamidase family protein [Thermoplasmata archaeon]|nr:acetamidase/formamidase family protein [Thermoplasmata archaeon]
MLASRWLDGNDPSLQQTNWSGDRPPIASVRSGDRIRVRLPDSSTGQLTKRSTRQDLGRLDLERVDAALGPIEVRGALAGDRLDVRVRSLRPGEWGWSGVFWEFGMLRGQFEDDLQLWTIGAGWAKPRGGFLPKVRIPTRPMLGWVGVAPAFGKHPMIPPRRTGGNLDHRLVGAGSVLSLPVEVDGALLSLGDPHAAQGDGEVCGTGIETSADVELELRVVPGAAPRSPFLAAPTTAGTSGPVLASLGVGPDLAQVAVEALEGLLDRLEEHGVPRKAGYLLASVAGELRISEAVDLPNYVVSASFPLRLLPRRTNVKGTRTSARPRRPGR